MEYLFRVCRPGGAAKLSLAASCLASVLWGTQVFAETPESEGNTESAEVPLEAQRVDINEYVVRGNTVLDAQDIEEAVYPFLGPGRSLADIESARDALQEKYQIKGYQSVYIELPEQQVQGGIVFLQVMETRVGRVRVVGAEHYSPKSIRDEVPALEEGGVPDFAQVQEELGQVNRTAGRQVMPLVREGQRPGTMDIDLQVDDEKPWFVNLGMNNDYSADTEELRSFVSVGHNNLWQLGHSIALTYFVAPEDLDSAEVWSGSYTMPLSERWSLRFAGFKSDSNVATVGGTNVLGKGHSYGVTATYALPISGEWAHAFSVGLDFKNFDEEVTFGGETDSMPIKYAPFTFGYSGFRYTEQSEFSLGVSLVANPRSLLGYGSEPEDFRYWKRWDSSPSFGVFKGDTSYLVTLPSTWRLSTTFGFQLASGPLISSEQLSEGGGSSVRGYLATEASGDDGYVVSQELITPSLSRYVGNYMSDWRFYAFADAAQVFLQDTLPEQEDDFSLASVGVGTRAVFNDWLSGSVDWALPLRDGPNTSKHDSRVHFSVQANF